MIPWWWLPITAVITWGFQMRLVFKGLRTMAHGVNGKSVLSDVSQPTLEALGRAVVNELKRREAAS